MVGASGGGGLPAGGAGAQLQHVTIAVPHDLPHAPFPVPRDPLARILVQPASPNPLHSFTLLPLTVTSQLLLPPTTYQKLWARGADVYKMHVRHMEELGG